MKIEIQKWGMYFAAYTVHIYTSIYEATTVHGPYGIFWPSIIDLPDEDSSLLVTKDISGL